MANFINMESASELLHRRAIPTPLNPPPNYNYFSNPSKTLLKEAIEKNDCEFLKTRIELSQEFRKPENLFMYKFDQHESNMLHLTAKYCSIDFLKVLVEDCKIEKINSPNKNLMTPLHYLVLFNNFNLMDESSIGKIESSVKYEKVKEYLLYLVSKGIDLNARDKWRFTALNYAAIKNNLVLTKLLVEQHLKALNNKGINKSAANILEEISKIKITPETMKQKLNENLCNSLIIACEHGSLDVANVLIRDYLDGKLLKLYDFKKNIYHLIAKNKQDSGNKIERIFTNVKEKLDDPDRKILSEKDKETGLNLLHMAISNHHFGILRILVSNRDDFDLVNNAGGPDEDWPLHFVAKSGSIECLEILKSENFGENLVNKLNKNLENIFHVAIAHKKNAFIRHLLNQKDIRSHIQEALVNKNLSLMTTPIEYAMYLGNLEAARMLEVWTDLDRVDFKSAGLQRSLFYACVENGHIDSIYYLFALLDRKYGLNWLEREQLLREAISLADEPDENTVFHLAAQNSNFEMIKYLIEKFPFVFDDILFYKNRLELSCFHICCKKGDEKSVRFLLEKSIAHGKQTLLLSSRDSHCNSPLHLACIHNHIQIARLLVEFGADLTQRNMHDQTPFHVCCDNSSLGILKYLFEVASQQSLNVHVDWEMMQLAIRKDDSQMFAFLSSNDLSYLFKDNERNVKVEMHDYFDLAFKTKSMSILQALIRDPNWMAYLKVDLNDPNLKTIDYSRFRILTNHMPNLALAILDKFATSEKTSIVYDFRFIDPTPKSVGFNLDNHPMFILSKTENSRILSHRVVKKLAKLKWTGDPEGFRNSMPVIIFIFHFLLFLTYLIFITLLICSVHNFMSSLKNADNAPAPLTSLNTTQIIPTNYSDYFKGSYNYSEDVNASQNNSTIRTGKLLKRSHPQDHFHQLVEQSWFNLLFTVSITLSSILLLKTALVQIFKMIDSIESGRSILKMLIKQSSEMIVYFLSLLYVVNISFVKFQFDLGLGFGPFLLIINWCLIMMFIDKLPYVGIFAIMFKKILFESIKILPILVIMLLAFGFSLNVIKEERNEWKSLFSTFLSSMEAMINISPDDRYKNTYLAGFVFFLFMCMISLVLLNLFIGVAIGEIENVYEDADVKQLSLKLEFCLRVQFLESKIVGDRSNMIPPTHEEDKTAKEIKDSKFGRRHFNYRLERENQEKQQIAFDEMKTKVDMIFRKLEIEEEIN